MRLTPPSFIYKPRTLLILYIIAAVFAAVQLYSMGLHPYATPKGYPDDIMNHVEKMNLFIGLQLTEYNNYLIFKNSFFNLIRGNNLYGLYPYFHWDYFKYSPTFALLMGPMAILPDLPGLIIWNIINALTVFFAVRLLPFDIKKQCLLLWFISVELLTCLQNSQSNGLMCGLIIAGFGCLRNGKIVWATLWLALATYIKVYGAVGFCLFLFYPGKFKFFRCSVLWMVIFAILPLLVISYQNLVFQYQQWASLVSEDAKSAVGLSVAGWLHSWFGINTCKTLVSVIGLVLFFVPFARFKLYTNELFRLLMLAFILIWVIIFNHKAESSTFIIAVAGVSIWYFASPAANWRTALMLLVFVFTSLSTTDVFPPYIKKHFIYPYTIKAVPCIIAWCVIFAEMMMIKKSKTDKTIPIAAPA